MLGVFESAKTSKFGFNYNKTVQTTNQIDKSVMESSGANFKINPLSVGLGLSFYIPTGVNRPKK